jgi:hypothetical protein
MDKFSFSGQYYNVENLSVALPYEDHLFSGLRHGIH